MAASEAAVNGEFEAALEKRNVFIKVRPSPLTLAKRADVLLKLGRLSSRGMGLIFFLMRTAQRFRRSCRRIGEVFATARTNMPSPSAAGRQKVKVERAAKKRKPQKDYAAQKNREVAGAEVRRIKDVDGVDDVHEVDSGTAVGRWGGSMRTRRRCGMPRRWMAWEM